MKAGNKWWKTGTKVLFIEFGELKYGVLQSCQDSESIVNILFPEPKQGVEIKTRDILVRFNTKSDLADEKALLKGMWRGLRFGKVSRYSKRPTPFFRLQSSFSSQVRIFVGFIRGDRWALSLFRYSKRPFCG